ncbi:MAG: isochorismatase family protein [Methylococcales bacterium]|jgi:nicotinamidase/pyrazinamidase|nr:isochorismatase family protein [Methylococcales bacterium]MBT7445275.1 isochorismatase family protein [Methylococcales bacterium]
MFEQLARKQVASFDVDAQNTFTPVCPDELPVPDGGSIVAELNLQASLACVRIGSKDAHSPEAIWVADEVNGIFTEVKGENVDVRWPLHAVPGSKGFELIEGLPEPAEYDYFVWKGVELNMHPYGACYHDLGNKMSTGVIEFAKINDIKGFVVAGLATDYCVKTTVLQLLQAGFQVVVNLGGCRGISDKTVSESIAEMQKMGAVMVDSAKQIQLKGE